MKTLIGVLIAALVPALAAAQPRGDATLRVTVVDPSGAIIVGAHVTLTPSAEGGAVDTGTRGDAVFTALEPGRVTIKVESPGFEAAEVRDVRLRPGDNRREVKLKIAKFAETVQVSRDPRERGERSSQRRVRDGARPGADRRTA